ncbi:Mov34/MPN/PAD-1 family protein [Qipengyuania seohaensis]|uniref:Mov34/MPN/PAD-1 family protein n=1 Tax=Qipengyuania seohaensis TaxID=266951 RepID=UPI000C22A4AD|nr:M67 family metallopeptidase [Qipengyuania seohaensis]
MMLELSSRLVEAMVSQAASAHPRECCGVLLGEGGRITEVRLATNVHPQPERHFEIDPQQLVDAHRDARNGGPAVLGYYHSHPNGRESPSAEDAAMAAGDGAVWAIIASDRVTFWRAGDGGFTALPYVVRER